MKQFLITALLGLFLAGCTTPGGNPVSSQDALNQTKQAYSVAQSAAVLYASLPLCAPSAPKVCADPKTVIQIDVANQAAVKAIAEADAAIKRGDPNALVLINAASAAASSLASQTPKVKP